MSDAECENGNGCLHVLLIAVYVGFVLLVGSHEIKKLKARVDSLEKAIKVEAPK